MMISNWNNSFDLQGFFEKFSALRVKNDNSRDQQDTG